MKICRFRIETIAGPMLRLGVLDKEEIIVDANRIFAAEFERMGRYSFQDRADDYCPNSLFQLLRLKEDPHEILEEAYGLHLFHQKIGLEATSQGHPTTYKLDDSDISLANPLDKINVYRDFYTHEKHVKKGFEKRKEAVPEEWYEMPVYYKGATAGFIGDGEEIPWPNYSQKLDYELELAAIIGMEGKSIRADEAYDHIFGFSILNDISARDIQKKEMKVRLGPSKGKDFCTVLGPVIVTADEFDNKEPSLKMTAKINGKEWSNGKSDDAHFTFAQMVEFASNHEWLLPGDVIGSGTVGTGCGLELDKWIKPGDMIELEVSKIGKLTNKVGSPIKEY